MKESIIIEQQNWGFLLTQNLNYSNSCESSLMSQFAEVCGNFRNIVTPHPDEFADVCEFSCKSCRGILLQRDICWKPWILAQTFPRSFCKTIWKGIFKVFSSLWENRPYQSFFLDLTGVLKHVDMSFEVQVIKKDAACVELCWLTP